MKKHLLLLCLSVLSLTGMNAQSWSTTLREINGLPGEEYYYYGDSYYMFHSKEFTPGGSFNVIRLTVTETVKNEAPNGNNVCFALSSLTVYDENGDEVPYIASSNADHNSLAWPADGDGLYALDDYNIDTYFHSMYSTPAVSDYHYIELALKREISTFSLVWSSRLDVVKNAPITVGITLGTEYIPEEFNTDFELGNNITTEQELTNSNQFFALKGNAVKSFTTADNVTYFGSGPIFYSCAEKGDTEANSNHIVQLIPFGDGRYYVYWPMTGAFLRDAKIYGDYNGANGWQYSTSLITEAALVSITSTNDGYFEISYDSEYKKSPITFYIGAELRDGVSSKMKIFDLFHKQALEKGDYTQQYSLPVAFNWSIYKADISDSVAKEISLRISDVAGIFISNTIYEAEYNLAIHGNFNGQCTNGEDKTLERLIDEAYALMESETVTLSEINKKKEDIQKALSQYLAVRLTYYSNRVNELSEQAQYSSYPNYIKDTYPASSKSILESMKGTIAKAKENITTYSQEQITAIYNNLERDIALFESTRCTVTTQKDEEKEDTEDMNAIYVYLSNGDIDAFLLEDMDGEQYTDKGTLYIPLKNEDVYYYTSEEYDSCTTTRPALPQMTSFKFNNKYNPNLHVDAVAEPVSNDMHFSLNAIGKWLTASFTLSDEKAVAYVDTVLQTSKETRQSFKKKVTYNVTYPGYYLIKRVKDQEGNSTEDDTKVEITDVELTADMLETNKPSSDANESLGNLLDNNPNTIFHSTWGKDNNATVNVNTYITIDLPEALDKMQVYYKCRPGTGYNPLVWEIYASNDGNSWELARTLSYTTDNMPRGGSGQEYTSPTIDLGGKYSKIKILQTQGEYSKNHLVLSELRIKKVTELSEEKTENTTFETQRIPFGNKYNVTVDWLTDIPNSVPRIDIDIENGEYVVIKDKYLKAKIRILGFGIYDNFEDSVQIKGRGNSSWGHDKKPYRLKFADKVKPFGLTKGKNWVLLANAQTGSLMANAISMKIGQLSAAEYTNHIVPVEVYMNGTYMGNYMFTEKIGMANNSVDVDEDAGHLLELDSNSDDEFKFNTTSYKLPVFVKEPDLYDPETKNIDERKKTIPAQFNEVCNNLIQGNDVSHLVDMDALARYMLANELALNQELGHPKSVFLFKENENDPNSKYKFGPIWDFDWGYGYEMSGYQRVYCTYGTTASVLNTNMYSESGYQFFYNLLQQPMFKKHYYKTWNDFIKNNSMDELMEYIDCYYTFAESSFQHNSYEWYGFTAEEKERHKSWLEERKNYIYDNLERYDVDDLIYTVVGDVNCNNQLTIHDAALITAYLNSNTGMSFNSNKADCDKNGKIELDDARMVATSVKEGEAPAPMYWYNTPQAMGEFYSEEYTMEVGDNILETELKLFSYDEEQYKAIQFDITLPENISLIQLTNGDAVSKHNFSYQSKGDNRYRIIAYSDEDKDFTNGDDRLLSLFVNAKGIVNEASRNIAISNIYVVDNNNNELRISDHAIRFTQTTGIGYNGATALIEGGDHVTVTLLKAQKITIYGIDGRKVYESNAKEGTTRISLPAGIYIVNGEKVAVR